ncbi:hypothetical protein T281_00895 [Rhodomicrobium udaipurense JA643]|nr:hypothetical protein T281_00895 [Rhodomicrobium udaipurense JA643]
MPTPSRRWHRCTAATRRKSARRRARPTLQARPRRRMLRYLPSFCLPSRRSRSRAGGRQCPQARTSQRSLRRFPHARGCVRAAPRRCAGCAARTASEPRPARPPVRGPFA